MFFRSQGGGSKKTSQAGQEEHKTQKMSKPMRNFKTKKLLWTYRLKMTAKQSKPLKNRAG